MRTRTWWNAGPLALSAVVACGRSTLEVEDYGIGAFGGRAAATRVEMGGALPNPPNLGGRVGSAGAGGRTGKATGGASGRGGTNVGGASMGCLDDPDLLDGLSFNASIANTFEYDQFTLHFDRDSRGGLSAVFGSLGQATRERLSVPDTGKYGASLGIDGQFTLLTRGDLGANSVFVWLNDLQLCVAPGGDAIDGSASVTVHTEHGDQTDEVTGDVRLTGMPDESEPILDAGAQYSDPLDPGVLRVSEPLALGAVAWIDWGDGKPVALAPVQQADTVVAFEFESIPPLDAVGAVSAEATDLAGLMLRDHVIVATVHDPGVQPLDGFESKLAIKTIDAVSPQSGELPSLVSGNAALAGAQSLYVPAGLKVILHFERPAGAASLSLELRPSNEGNSPTKIVLRAGAVGDKQVLVQEVDVPGGISPNDGSAGAAGAAGANDGAALPIQRVSFDLPASGSDVLLEIETPYVETTSLEAASVVVDDVTF
jgi:hypothetical protein